ncbi:hypothetical protein GGI20_002145 [Coemansia sp. BCRC 34301]|nr:hypothetical protein GGI20_002145 [Coemansia sp. BCRC 34301]
MLQDQLLERLPLLERAWISDKFVGTSVIISIIGGCVCARGWRQRLMLIRRIGWMVAVLYFLRSITISVTTVPPSIGSCKIAVPQSMWQVIKATPDILAGNIGQCTDKIFSGHTAILLISFLFWQRYATHWIIRAYSAVHTTVGILTVLLARYHYTIDVVIGALLTFFVHHLYYSALDFAIRIRTEHDAQMAVAWSKLSLSEEEAHALFRPPPSLQDSDNSDRALYCDDGDVYCDGGGYKMSVLSRAPPLTGTTEDGSGRGWNDYDSAVGVDVHRTDGTDESHHAYIVRKRETSSATAMSSDVGDGDTSGGHRQPPDHHEITVLDSQTVPLNVHHRRLPPADSLGHPGRGYVSANAMLDMMGVNRPLGSFLPNLVSWMDGLDLRYPIAHHQPC